LTAAKRIDCGQLLRVDSKRRSTVSSTIAADEWLSLRGFYSIAAQRLNLYKESSDYGETQRELVLWRPPRFGRDIQGLLLAALVALFVR
jgi:hypothetical protein